MSPTGAGLVQLAVLLLALAVAWRPLGDWMARVFTDTRHWRVERAIYRLVRVDPDSEQRWTTYAVAVLAISFVGVVLLYLLQRLQALLGADLGRGAVSPSVAFNTAVSFVTNTNWQSYVPETTMGHFVQMAGLTVQNFLSAAVGLAVAVAVVRGVVRAGSDRLGNAWVDITRGCVRILLPLAVVGAVVLIALGTVMSLKAGVAVTGPDGRASTDRARAGRLPGGDQGTGDERRRHPQRQLGAPVREPDRPHRPPRNLLPAAGPGVADADLRAHGRVGAPGRRAARRDGHAVGPDARGHLGRRGDTRRGRPRSRRARTSRARRSASASRPRRCSRTRPRGPRRAR